MSTHQQSFPARPPLNRGQTVPLPVRRDIASDNDDANAGANPFSQAMLAQLATRQGAPPYAQSTPVTPTARVPSGQSWPLSSPLPAPPASSSSVPPTPSQAPFAEDAYFPGSQFFPQASSSSNASTPRPSKPATNGAFPPGVPQPPPPSPPSVVIPTSNNSHLPRGSYNSVPQQNLGLSTRSTLTEHILSARIGPGFDSSNITISTRKGNVLDIIAGRWDVVTDFHFEWQVYFDRDADMSSIRASYTSDVLTVTVARVPAYSGAGFAPARR